MPAESKARLEEILEDLEALLPVVRESVESFKKLRNAAIDADSVSISDLTFAVVIDDETIPLDSSPQISRRAVQGAMQDAMAHQGHKVSKLWIEQVGPLVSNAIAICMQAESEGSDG